MKNEVISFKADSALVEALSIIPNKSEFIREAIFSAMENTCPLCGGSGKLSASQQKHWEEFSRNHRLSLCEKCRETILVCQKEEK